MIILVQIVWFIAFGFFGNDAILREDVSFELTNLVKSAKVAIEIGLCFCCFFLLKKQQKIYLFIALVIILVLLFVNCYEEVSLNSYDINVQLQTLLALIHPVALHVSITLPLLYLLSRRSEYLQNAWLLLSFAIILGSVWAFMELG